MSGNQIPGTAGDTDKKEEPYDYIIVGSGPGGGPLAARLALAGKRVLVLEAGGDPRHAPTSPAYPNAQSGEVHEAPGLHAAATEDPTMSWMFSVRHYENNERQAKDAKYNKSFDPNTPPGANPVWPIPNRFLDSDPPKDKRGILYPRSAGLGGCTGHHAMIMAVPNDKDWDEIANLTGDDTWRAAQMRGYFTKIERCEYVDAYGKWFRKFVGVLFVLWQKLVLVINPRAILDEGGHGKSGWQPTNFIDPDLVETIAKTDRSFFNVLTGTVISVLERSRPLVAMLKKALFRARVVQYLDPNDYNTRRTKPEGVFLIPTGTSGRSRTGLREHLLQTQAELEANPLAKGKLKIEQGVHVTRVIFADEGADKPPRAIGVECRRGDFLYSASPRFDERPEKPETIFFFTEGEVILSGGAFNTPQLLMLSGIGNATHLQENGVDGIAFWDAEAKEAVVSGRPIHLPGVGKNLQDRYEVSVISELNKSFVTLTGQNISFTPGDKDDQAAKEWREHRTGLYGTNGGTLAVLRRSCVLSDHEKEPDTFSFGAPVAFRGYYWGWSRELLRRTLGAKDPQSNLWSWIILKAYTDNNHGTVTLRTNNASDTPNICFRSFDEGPAVGARKDVRALADTVKFFREVNARSPRTFVNEVQPGVDIPNDSPEMDEWIKTQAWGHHACGTCRIGSDAWQRNPKNLSDKDAVLDSKFRVHGVKNLRVVDASVFPRIPGYFILTPIFMVSEKAADTLLTEPWDAVYPPAMRRLEAEAVAQRRSKADGPKMNGKVGCKEQVPGKPHGNAVADTKEQDGNTAELPKNTVGLALSGGGIRSATFALGVLQALAEKGRLKQVDILSTVSGGGFIGSFLGRLFTRKMVTSSSEPPVRVEELLKAPSAPLHWLRTHANYILGAGSTDVRQNLGLYLRNTFCMHLVAGTVLFGVFGLLCLIGKWITAFLATRDWLPGKFHGLELSNWWWLPLGLLICGVVPALLGYWLAPKAGTRRIHPPYPTLAAGVLLAGAITIAALPGTALVGWLLVVTILLAWFWQEAARWDAPPDNARQGVVVRNRLTRALGDVLFLFLATAGWVILDTLARNLAGESGIRGTMMMVAASLAPLLPVLRFIAEKARGLLSSKNSGSSGKFAMISGNFLGYALATFLLFALDLMAHWVCGFGTAYGFWWVTLALAFSLCLGRAFDFLNLSTLQPSYSARLTRTFLGASNEARLFGSQDENSADVQLAHPGDDMALKDYHPHVNGGPLHLINVCVNETVDVASEREVRERQGLSMCLGPAGVSVGRRHHSVWSATESLSFWQKLRLRLEGREIDADKMTALRPILPNNDPNAFHVLANRKGHTAPVESLSVGQWIGISGAAFSTGLGRITQEGISLFMGIVNVRLGHWWDSGIDAGERPGRYPASLWRRLKRLPFSLFKMQSVLFAEWRARFAGPSERLWYLSDGGHFENTGLYELIRRRVPFCIVTDGGKDSSYQWEDIARMSRQVRQDFHAKIEWMDPREERMTGKTLNDWNSFKEQPPNWIRDWLQAKAIGSLDEIFIKAGSKGPFCAALAKVTYHKVESPYANQLASSGCALEAVKQRETEPPDEKVEPANTWILLLKASLIGSETQDVLSYAATHPAFPQDTTVDQVFDDEQWESYRALGVHVADKVINP